jgi:hypothetical protein
MKTVYSVELAGDVKKYFAIYSQLHSARLGPKCDSEKGRAIKRSLKYNP